MKTEKIRMNTYFLIGMILMNPSALLEIVVVVEVFFLCAIVLMRTTALPIDKIRLKTLALCEMTLMTSCVLNMKYVKKSFAANETIYDKIFSPRKAI